MAAVNKHINTPAKPNASLMHTHPNRVRLALLEKREECRLLNAQIGRMKEEIKKW